MLFYHHTNIISPLLIRRNFERFKGPNDIVIDSNDNLYFTDQGQTDQTGKIYRLSPDGKLDRLAENGILPDGLVLSLNERFLYVAMTRANLVWRLTLYINIYTHINISAFNFKSDLAFPH